MCGDKRRRQIRLQHQIPLGRAQLFRLFAHCRASIVDQDVEAAEQRCRPFNRFPARGLVSRMHLHEMRLPDRAQFCQRAFAFGPVAPSDHNSGPGACQPLGHAKADPAVP
jgi:hypothetical protein